ncbi:ABC transporter ATP-binding protein [Egibacter rhizosphaerae]|uniref:ABC transporter ATP-binding protein n=1 Tax=Egibacter rhizosphaerae TaxID=1670831 RepID=UPI00197B026A|nr:ABC transporter ATP-binding protein [Egibacter rhizosphaerae]
MTDVRGERSSGEVAGDGPVLRAEGLRTHFQQGESVVRAVDGVSLEVHPGEIVAIVGESGSGKTATGMSLMRLINRRIIAHQEGRVTLRTRSGEEVDLLAASDRVVRHVRGGEIGMIFQDPMTSLNPVFTIGNQIVEGIREHRSASRHEAREVARDLLRSVGLGEVERLMRVFPHQLSGGMRQRAMIAMALAGRPRLLIADEPTTALDVTVQAQIVRLLQDLAAERGMGVVFITHDLALVSRIADRVCVMYAGQVVEAGAAAEVFARPRHPYTIALAGCIPYGPSGERLNTIPGKPPNLAGEFAGCRFAARCDYAVPACSEAPVALRAVEAGRSARCIRAEEIS